MARLRVAVYGVCPHRSYADVPPIRRRCDSRVSQTTTREDNEKILCGRTGLGHRALFYNFHHALVLYVTRLRWPCTRDDDMRTLPPADVSALQWRPVSQKITREDNKKMLGVQRVGWWQHAGAVPWR